MEKHKQTCISITAPTSSSGPCTGHAAPSGPGSSSCTGHGLEPGPWPQLRVLHRLTVHLFVLKQKRGSSSCDF